MPKMSRRKFGNIRKRTDGNRIGYEARYKIGKNESGVDKLRTKYFKTYAEADRYLNKVYKHIMKTAKQHGLEKPTNVQLFRLCNCEDFCAVSKYAVPAGEKYIPSEHLAWIASEKKKERLKNFIAGKEMGGTENGDLRDENRLYLIAKAGKKCQKVKLNDKICGYDGVKSSGLSNLEINHIDGNPYNHFIDNLEVVCPNCHRELPTFRWSDFTRKRRSKTPRNPNSYLVPIRKGHLKNKQNNNILLKEKENYG